MIFFHSFEKCLIPRLHSGLLNERQYNSCSFQPHDQPMMIINFNGIVSNVYMMSHHSRQRRVTAACEYNTRDIRLIPRIARKFVECIVCTCFVCFTFHEHHFKHNLHAFRTNIMEVISCVIKYTFSIIMPFEWTAQIHKFWLNGLANFQPVF